MGIQQPRRTFRAAQGPVHTSIITYPQGHVMVHQGGYPMHYTYTMCPVLPGLNLRSAARNSAMRRGGLASWDIVGS